MISKSNTLTARLAQLVTAILLLTGCGGGEGPTAIPGTPRLLSGTLVDAPIGGARFTTPTQQGFTGVDGGFLYRENEMITFAIGDIVLGTVAAAPLITPVELTGSVDPTAPAAVNMMVFLQTIDIDSNPLNGITISNAARTAAAGQMLDFNSPTFATDVVTVLAALAPGKPVISATQALANFYEAYRQFGGSLTVSWPFPGKPPFPDPTPVQLLTNGNFDDTVGGTAVRCGNYQWDCFDPNLAFVVTGGSNSPAARSGTRVLKLFGADGASLQSVPAKPGTLYTARAFAQNWTGGGATERLNARTFIELAFLDENRVLIDGSGVSLFGQEVPVTADEIALPPDQWVEMSVAATAPPNAAFARILLFHLDQGPNAPQGGVVFFDDAELLGPDFSVPAPPTPVADLALNGSFEAPDASGADQACTENWQCINSAFTVSNAGPGNSPAARTGTQVLKQFGADGSSYLDVPALAGENYIASVWAQNFSGDPLANAVSLQLFFLDSNGAVIGGPGPVVEKFGAADPFLLSPGDVLLNPDTWTEISVQAVAPSNAVTVRMQMIHLEFITPGGAIFWDDATLTGPTDGRALVWAEEFNGASLDTGVWNYDTGFGDFGWGNNEWQNYTNQLSNVRIFDTGTESVLRITADCSEAPANPQNCNRRDGTITSGRINTAGKFDFRFGRVEARIRVPGEIGSWPAFWMLGAKFPQTGWPKAGEIDILELFNRDATGRNKISGAMHWCDESADANNNNCANFPSGKKDFARQLDTGSSLASDFHIYEMIWDASSVTMNIDGREYFTLAIDPVNMEEFLDNFYFILNVAVGGRPIVPDTAVNLPAGTGWPMIMDVDYIRVYQ